MQPLAVDVLLLRAAAPDLPLTVGRTLVARVLERGLRGVGILNLAGAIVTAELPASVRAGDRLRLVVREATAERVVLGLATGAPTAPPAAPSVPFAGGRVAVVDRDGGRPDDEAGAVALRCELPGLGPVELRLALDAATVRAHVALPAGAPLALGRARAEELRSALARAAGRRAEVTVAPPRAPVDVYA